MPASSTNVRDCEYATHPPSPEPAHPLGRVTIGNRNPDAGCVLWWLMLAMVATLLLAPLLITDVPPVLDYPNHLARLVLLHAGPDDAVLGPVFSPHWTIIPNLAIDVIGTPLLGVLPVHVAGRTLLGGILLLNLAGAVALHRALFGRRSYWPLGSALVAYNCTFLLGFLNWAIGSGLAMLCAAVWLTWRERRPVATILAASVAAVLLFFCHLMGLAFFLVLIGSAELHAARTNRGVAGRAAGLLAVGAGPVMLSLLTTLRDVPASMHWMSLYDKTLQVATPFINYDLPLDLFSVTVVYGGIILGIATGRLVVAPRAVVALLAVVAAYLVLPFDLKGASFLDTRFAIMAGWLVFAVIDPVVPRPIAWRLVAVGGMVLFLVRMGVLADAWTDHRRDLADLRSVIADVPPGAAVYVTNVPRDEAPAYWDAGPRSRRLSNTLRMDYHQSALLLIERGAFWPGLFANPAQQPIRLRADYDRLALAARHMPSHAGLVAEPDTALPALLGFDYVLMLEAGADPNLTGFLPRCLLLVARTDFAALFRVMRDAPACAGGPS